MKILWLLLPFLTASLAGCTQSELAHQRVLDEYATSAFSGDLSLTLTGSALAQASQSRALLVEMGWTQLGASRFEQTRQLGDSRVSSCLDVSGVQFVDALGSVVSVSRSTDRLLMQVEFTNSQPPLIADIREVGKC